MYEKTKNSWTYYKGSKDFDSIIGHTLGGSYTSEYLVKGGWKILSPEDPHADTDF